MAVVLAAAMPLCLLPGCRVSDTFTEVVYQQDAKTIDYDNPQKFYINDATATEKSDQVSAKETDSDGTGSESEQNLVVYGSKPNTEGFTAKKSAFSNKPDFTGIEASESVSFFKSDEKDAVDHTVTKQEPKERPEEKKDDSPEGVSAQSSTATGDSDNARVPGASQKPKDQESDAGGGGNGKKKTQNKKKDKTTSEGAQSDETTGKQARKKDPTRAVYDSSDPTQEPPKVEKVAAFGEFATIVQMVAGTGALVATDADNLSSKFTKVFDTSKVRKGWKDGGSAKKMDVAQIVKSGAQVILVTDAAYLEALSNADFGKLTKANINTVVLRPMTTSQNIKKNVVSVGKMLDGSTAGKHGKQAEERAQAYVDFHDQVIGDCIAANNGKYEGSRVYQGSGKCDVDAKGTEQDETTYTLLSSAYDKEATYKGLSLGSASWMPAKGLVYAESGYGTTPVSYYMQCGGLVNNAAAASTKASAGMVPLWQFSANTFGFSAGDWSGITVPLAGDSAIRSMDRVLLDSGKNGSNRTGLGSGFGTSSFPKIIVTKQSIKAALIANSEKGNGMYTPYGWNGADGTGRVIEAYGANLGNIILYSTIGVDGDKANADDGNLMGDVIPDDAILVNPHGVFSDWTQGSVDAFLEAAWISDVANDEANGVDWKAVAKDFYKSFYDYDVNISSLTD
ncbi:MAG: hypothetical protein Q4D06_06920 [Coriobacteriia bacterium]|nr:hypothetical protein [Coriobacteriia bacterium]